VRDVLLLVVGLGLLTYAADRFVIGAVRVATTLRVSTVLIGALVIGFGTSAPELLVSALAASSGRQDIALGNVVGSNMTNVLLVVGAAAAFGLLPITVRIWRQEIRLMLVAVAGLALVCADLRVSALDAVLLLVGAVASVGLILRWASRDRAAAAELADEIEDLAGGEHGLPGSVALTVLGLLGTLGGAQLLVEGASGLAASIGLSEAVIGLTVVAVGTSLPELVTAIAAVRHGEDDLIVGNVVGSNIFNSLPVAGLAGLLGTSPLDPQFRVSLLLMLAACTVFALFARTGFRIGRVEGAVLLGGFATATVLTF
jgi:cation:H+ antiporter